SWASCSARSRRASATGTAATRGSSERGTARATTPPWSSSSWSTAPRRRRTRTRRSRRRRRRPAARPARRASGRRKRKPPPRRGRVLTRSFAARFLSAPAGVLALLLAFVWSQRIELGRLPEAALALLAGLARGGLAGAQGVRESAAGACAALLLLVAWYGAGDLLLRLLARGAGDGPPASLAWARRCALGAGLWSHLGLAVGALVDVPYNIPGLRALGAEMSGVWGMLLGRLLSHRAGEAAFGAAMFAYFPLLLAVVHGWARERGLGRGLALTAAALVASAPVAWEVAGAGYVDLALALYVVLAFRAAARWFTGGGLAALAELALALGFALSVKPLAAAALVLLAL